MEEMEEDPCEIPEVQIHRWYIVALIGTILSLISIVCNTLIARVLLQRKHSNFFFLGLLAVSDLFLSFCYFPVIAMEVVRFNVGLWLVKLWSIYLNPLFAICQIAMTFSCFLIILGTIERYLITVKSQYLSCFRHSRGRFSLIMLCIAMLLRGTAVFEFQMVKNGECEGIMEFEPDLTELSKSWIYGTIFKFYLRTIMTVFIPFALLSLLNYKIVTILRRQQRSAQMFRFGSSEHKVKARSATRLLVLIVFSYLLANALNVVVTSWEFVNLNSTSDYYTIYELMNDLVSVLYVSTCASRLIVYIISNEEIRFALYDYLCGSRKKLSTAHDYKPIQKLHYDGSIRQKSISNEKSIVGTEFDKIALALVLSQRAKDLRENFLAIPTNGASEQSDEKDQHQNGDIKTTKKETDVNDNDSFIITNPLANVSPATTPTNEHKTLPSNNNNSSSSAKQNMVVKLVP